MKNCLKFLFFIGTCTWKAICHECCIFGPTLIARNKYYYYYYNTLQYKHTVALANEWKKLCIKGLLATSASSLNGYLQLGHSKQIFCFRSSALMHLVILLNIPLFRILPFFPVILAFWLDNFNQISTDFTFVLLLLFERKVYAFVQLLQVQIAFVQLYQAVKAANHIIK